VTLRFLSDLEVGLHVGVLTRDVVAKHVLVIDCVERLTRKWTWAHVPGHAVRMRLQGFLIRSRSLRWVRRDNRPAHKDRMGQVNQSCGSFLGVEFASVRIRRSP